MKQVPQKKKRFAFSKFNLAIFMAVLLIVASISTFGLVNLNRFSPELNEGKKWKMGYYEGGPYIHYTLHLRYIISGLINYGWMEPIEIPNFENQEDSWLIWQFLVGESESEFISFESQNYWSSGWNSTLRELNKIDFLNNSSISSQIDLVLAMGTWAGQDLANSNHSIATMVCSTSDPISAGIIETHRDSGYDHLYTYIDSTLIEREIQVFYNIFQFSNLGVIYEDTPIGRTYSNVMELNKSAAKNNFNLITRISGEEFIDQNESLIVKYFLDNLTIMAENDDIDAFWMSGHYACQPQFLPDNLRLLIQSKIPVWSTLGTDAVRNGALISISESFEEIGNHLAQVAILIWKGVKPRRINQEYSARIEISINLQTAYLMDYTFPESILEIADIKYNEIEGW